VNKDDSWEIVFSTKQQYKVELVKAILEENAVTSVVVNKQDSSYLVFGEIEIYTPKHYANKAKLLITNHEL